MSITPPPVAQQTTTTEEVAELAIKRVKIARGRADAASGKVYNHADVEIWVRSWVHSAQ
jgi:predicted transcriptional regulator